jgi:pimeloyl-ACP methyl ester carboxylesterase
MTMTKTPFKTALILAFALLSVNIISSCSSAVNLGAYLKTLPETSPAERITTTKIPYPIVLLHGLGQKVNVWDAFAVRYYEEEIGLNHGGILRKVNGKAVLDTKLDAKSTSNVPANGAATKSRTADFFTVAFSNPTDSIGAWERELEEFLPLVFQRTKADKVILIGYSMGGVTARYYLTKHVSDHRTERIITIGSPHQGSPYAQVAKWKKSLQEKAKDANFMMKPLFEKGLEMFSGMEDGVPADAPAVRDLMRPEDGGEFMSRTALANHPLDVDYVSVVGKVDLFNGGAWSKAGAMDVMRRVLAAIGYGGVEALFESGDGVVSAKSQNMSELPWFQVDKRRQKISRTIALTTVHEDHLKQSNEIQRLSLEDKPEFKGAEFYRNTDGTQARMIVEFVDYLPPSKCGVDIIIDPDKGEKQRFMIPQSDISLVRKKNGSIVAQAVFPFPQGIDWARPAELEIIVRNTFGNTTTTTKNWLPRNP